MLENFNELVKRYKKANDAGEDTSIYALAISACREWNEIGENTINANVVHAVHEFAHMLAADPAKYINHTADDAVNAFFENISSADIGENILDDDYPGVFVPKECKNQTGPAFAKSLLRQSDFEDLFAKFDQLQMVGAIKAAVSNLFRNHNERGGEEGSQVQMHLLSGEDALDFLRGMGVHTKPEATLGGCMWCNEEECDHGAHMVPPEYAASGETSGPVAHNDNGAEERGD